MHDKRGNGATVIRNERKVRKYLINELERQKGSFQKNFQTPGT